VFQSLGTAASYGGRGAIQFALTNTNCIDKLLQTTAW
jgi:hypothetical protein